jgi:hypothetical protein
MIAKIKAVRLAISGLTVEMHLASGVPLTMNVTKDADTAYLAELKRTDRLRYDRLMEAMRKQAYANLRKAA